MCVLVCKKFCDIYLRVYFISLFYQSNSFSRPVCVCICACMCVHMCMYVCAQCMYMCAHVYVCVCIWVYVCVCSDNLTAAEKPPHAVVSAVGDAPTNQAELEPDHTLCGDTPSSLWNYLANLSSCNNWSVFLILFYKVCINPGQHPAVLCSGEEAVDVSSGYNDILWTYVQARERPGWSIHIHLRPVRCFFLNLI